VVNCRLPTMAARVQTRVWSCGILWWTKVALGQVSPANLHSIYFSTIVFTITRGWHNRPGVAAVPIASQSRIKKNKTQELVQWLVFGQYPARISAGVRINCLEHMQCASLHNCI
jgi:hypothetical protein